MDSFMLFGNIGTHDPFTVLKLNTISDSTKEHLIKVYLAVLGCSTAAWVGFKAFPMIYLSGIWNLLFTFGIIMWLAMDTNKNVTWTRSTLFGLFGFMQGNCLAPLLTILLEADPHVVESAIIGTMIVFTCFSAAALTAQRRSYLYLGAFLASGVSLLFYFSLFNLFFGSSTIFQIELYLGLLVFSGYIIFDTQFIVEKTEFGFYDVIGDAMNLFVDLIAVFVRLLIILTRSSQRKRERR